MGNVELSLSFWILYLIFPLSLWVIAFIKFLNDRGK